MSDLALPSPLAVRAWWWRHPELPAVAVIVAAWIGLGLDHWAGHGTMTGWQFSFAAWVLMVVAMMVPGVLPMQRWVAFNSLWRRRHRTAAIFTTTYIVAWAAVGGALYGVVVVGEITVGGHFSPDRWWVAASLLVAAGWHVVPTRKRAMRRCHLRRPLAARGWRSDLSAARYGLFVSRACVVSCGGIMTAMFVGAHDFHVMVPLTAIVLIERFQVRPDERIAAIAIVGVAAVSLVG